MKPVDKRCLKKALLAAVARLFSVVLGAGAGNLLYGLLGGIKGWPVALALAVSAFFLLWYVEYVRDAE